MKQKLFKFTFGLRQQAFPYAVRQWAADGIQFTEGSLPFFRPRVDGKRRVICQFASDLLANIENI